jgi:cytochrome c oxidase assembly protein subunit 15
VSRLGSTNIALNHQFSGIGRRALSNSSRVLQATASTSAATLQSAGTAQATSVPPIVGYWLMGSAALVFGIVVLGGLTRLTESGLSIVEWNVLKGVWPPIGQKAWEEEFEKYKQYPEYKV